MKPAILTFVSHYLPGYRGGGPIRTIANMVERLGDEFDFRVITSDRDLNDEFPYRSVKVGAWNTVGKAEVFYAGPAQRSLRALAGLMRRTPHDLVYLNSFFNPVFSLRPLLARRIGLVARKPLLIAPRGELSDGAFRLKRWKKAPFTTLARFTRIFDDATWHASTEFEASDIYRMLGQQIGHAVVAKNLVIEAPDLTTGLGAPLASHDQSAFGVAQALRVCFLSRISPMKNLDYALKVMATVSAPIEFNIYGPKESIRYWDECEKLIASLPSNVVAVYRGAVEHTDVRATIAGHDVFFVPTRGENFGHVFMEALSAGVPLLVSDQTPWRDLKNRLIGWDIPLANPSDFASALEHAAQRSRIERAMIRMRCIEFAHQYYESGDSLEMNRYLLNVALGDMRTSMTT